MVYKCEYDMFIISFARGIIERVDVDLSVMYSTKTDETSYVYEFGYE